MSLEDARCKVVRYFPSNQPFSSTPRIYDPRSGEILQTYIGWSHSKLNRSMNGISYRLRLRIQCENNDLQQ
jgi:hypothetical protein